jgi:hypothetical protein
MYMGDFEGREGLHALTQQWHAPSGCSSCALPTCAFTNQCMHATCSITRFLLMHFLLCFCSTIVDESGGSCVAGDVAVFGVEQVSPCWTTRWRQGQGSLRAPAPPTSLLPLFFLRLLQVIICEDGMRQPQCLLLHSRRRVGAPEASALDLVMYSLFNSSSNDAAQWVAPALLA